MVSIVPSRMIWIVGRIAWRKSSYLGLTDVVCSYLGLIDFVYHSTLGLIVIKKKEEVWMGAS